MHIHSFTTQAHSHKFKQQRVAEAGTQGNSKKRKLPGEGMRSSAAAVKDRTKLSFGDDEEQEDGG